MSDSEDSSEITQSPSLEVIFEQEVESSEDPPRDEWSSINIELPDANIKRINHSLGLYDPGSGEICANYIPLSDSSVFRHLYYNYPGIVDPGIKEALFHPPPPIIYADDGQELYLALCKEMGLAPIRRFYKQLLQEEINLRYYGINLSAFRAIAMSLKLNKLVKVMDLTDNWIGIDGCFHLGDMLISNNCLQELDFTGCRIGPEGAKNLFFYLSMNYTVRKLNISKNQLTDTGVEYLASAIFQGCKVVNINLSYNSLTAKSVLSLSQAFETNNKLTHLDLSWNNIVSPKALYELCAHLSENKSFKELNLAWNGLFGVGNAIKRLLKSRSIQYLSLNNNNLKGPAIRSVGTNLNMAKNLKTLDLSNNPMEPVEALKLLLQLTNENVKLQRLLLDNVMVDMEFIQVRQNILNLEFRRNTIITYGDVRTPFTPHLHDMRELMFDRAEVIWKRKPRSGNLALIALELYKEDKEPMDVKLFYKAVKNMGSLMDDDLITGICTMFPGPRTEKMKTINLKALVEYVKRKWPDVHLTPTPPMPPIPPTPPTRELKSKQKKK